jgi:hypothetical protein
MMRKILSAPLIALVPFLLSACANPGMQGGSNVQLQQAINTVGAMLNGTVPTSATGNGPTSQPTAPVIAAGEGTPKFINGVRIIIDGPHPTDPRWAGKSLESTPLYKLFERYPLESFGNFWPRVSIHIDDYSETLGSREYSGTRYTQSMKQARPLECIKFSALIWSSEKKSQKVDGVVICSVDIKSDDRHLSLGAMRAYRGIMSPSIYSSQQLRTAGPRIPRQLLPQSTGEDNTFYSNADYLISSMFVKMSYQGPIDGDARLWFVNLTNAKF